ncbi:MAG: hypothetical protein ACI87H_001428 [Gammaproteobacteria bacterium]|jgi:hypothetical protein
MLGHCLCSSIEFETDGPLTDISLCHCSICRKVTGSAFAAYASVAIEDLHWRRGEERLKKFTLNEQLSKYFCSRCGSTLMTFHSQVPGFYHLSLGNLDDDQNIAIEYHQYVDSKASWERIDDGLTQYPGWPTDAKADGETN